jgi:hypothetical protein
MSAYGGKTGSDRRTVKSARMTRTGHCVGTKNSTGLGSLTPFRRHLRWCSLKRKSCSWKRDGPKFPFGRTGSDHAVGRHRTFKSTDVLFVAGVSAFAIARVRKDAFKARRKKND